MRVLKIDSERKQILSLRVSSWRDFHPLLGDDCRSISTKPIGFENRDQLVTDDEGRLNSSGHGFMIKGWHKYVPGNAILHGLDDQDKEADVKTKIEELQDRVIWLTD